MPIFFQQQINDTTRLGVWKIEENEEFFKGNVPLHRYVTHPHKRLQHLAGRFLLQFLYPDFPYNLIQIADTRKPFLPDEQYHFSISHCGDYAAAIVSKTSRVGVDIEIPTEKILKVSEKFLSPNERANPALVSSPEDLARMTILWSCKEAVFKWYGYGSVDFREHIQLQTADAREETIDLLFTKTNEPLRVHYHQFDAITLAWTNG